jgi:V/A-type H+-transporting ATPase subunit A
MLKLILSYYYKAMDAIKEGVDLNKLFNLPVRERIGRAKYVPQKNVDEEFLKIEKELAEQMEALVSKEGE